MMFGTQGNWAGGDWVTSRRSEELSGAVLGVDWRAEVGHTCGPGPQLQMPAQAGWPHH